MRFILRVAGTWMLVLALILVVVDGTKTLAANALMLTSAGELWRMIGAQSLLAFEQWATTAPGMIAQGTDLVLSWPASVITAVLGVMLVLLGRVHKRHAKFTEV